VAAEIVRFVSVKIRVFWIGSDFATMENKVYNNEQFKLEPFLNTL
jgi:hypothetical protein